MEEVDAPFARDNDGLTCTISTHGGVCILRNGEEMRLEFASPPAVVCLYDFRTIESDTLEGVDGNEDNSGVCIDAVLSVTIADCVKD